MDKTQFQEKGVLHLRGIVPQRELMIIRQCIFAEMERLQLKEKGRLISRKIQDLPVFQQTGRLGEMIKCETALEKLVSEKVLSLVNELDQGTFHPSKPQLLLSFPHKLEWSTEDIRWHLDITRSEKDEIPGIQIFFLLDDVSPKGGGTLALSGSHKVDLQKQQREPLGTNFPIIEMSGKAGDVYLMDMRILHAPSINSSKKLRMMATVRCLRSTS